MKTVILVVAIFTFVSLSCIVLFGDSPSLRNTPIQRVKKSLLKQLQKASKSFSELDHKLNGKLTWSLGWSVPVFYLAVISTSLYFFFRETYPKVLPSLIVESWAHTFYIYISISILYVSTLLVIYSDPGIIKNGADVARACARSPYNELIFFSGNECSTCKLLKPARSKHCSTCGHCVMVFDHHCIWLNNCVGYYNYRWFLLYLIANINFLFYGGILSFAGLKKAREQYADLSWWKLIVTTTEEVKITGVFVILCFLFVIITTAFTLLHLRYIYLGVTTNELDKWSELEYLVELGTLFKIDGPDGKFVERGMYFDKANNKYIQAFISLNDEKVLFTEDDKDFPKLSKVESVERDLDNIYDRGFIENLADRVCIKY